MIEQRGQHLPSTTILRITSHLDLDTVDAVHTVKEEDQDEDECDLSIVSGVSCPATSGICSFPGISVTFNPYCSFAIIGLSARNVKSLRFMVNGIGTMRAKKITISRTSRRKT
jgi:hypothetical protein